jgi:multicomponent Na+:H+ antiporter subunit B
MVLLTLMAIITVGVIRLRNLFAVVILSGIYSFLMASVMIVLDAVDVSMTEASVGAGISTVLMLGTLYLTKTEESKTGHNVYLPLFVSCVVAAGLVYGTIDLPGFGDPAGPVHHHVAPYYLENSIRDTLVPNVVTSVLSSYRGFDTLGETTVVFAAGIGILVLLKGGRRGSMPSGPSALGDRRRSSPLKKTSAGTSSRAAGTKKPASIKAPVKRTPAKKAVVKRAAAKGASRKKSGGAA